MLRGISTNLNLENIAANLTDRHIDFAARYYSRTTKQWQKRLQRSEAEALTKQGIALVSVYEDGPTSAGYFSESRGLQDGKSALAYAAELGQPPGSAIYFAVDYDALKTETETVIAPYFESVKQALAPQAGGQGYKIGVYGSGRVCDYIKEKRNLAAYSWLAESHGWAGYETYTMPDIRQEAAHSALLSMGLHYEDNFAAADFGEFSKLIASSGPVPNASAAASMSASRASDDEPSVFARRLAATAREQYEHYHFTSEDQPPLKEQIRAYWEDLGLNFPGVKTPWSAVFVSWVVRHAGASPEEFRASNAHSRFVNWAIHNSIDNTGVFRAERPEEYAPRIGDIIHNNRDNQSINYDFAAAHQAYASHSAIVVELGTDTNGKYAMTVGGNEGDTVARRRHSVHPDGKLVQRTVDPYICIIRNLK